MQSYRSNFSHFPLFTTAKRSPLLNKKMVLLFTYWHAWDLLTFGNLEQKIPWMIVSVVEQMLPPADSNCSQMFLKIFRSSSTKHYNIILFWKTSIFRRSCSRNFIFVSISSEKIFQVRQLFFFFLPLFVGWEIWKFLNILLQKE